MAIDAGGSESRSFPIRRFKGNLNRPKLIMIAAVGLVCVLPLWFLTFGLALFCFLPVVVVIALVFHCSLKRDDTETITFNNNTRMLESHSYPHSQYGEVRIEAHYNYLAPSIAVFIFIDEMEPVPFAGAVRSFVMLPTTSRDPKFEVPLLGLDVLTLRDTMHEISSFSGILAQEPPVEWEQIQMILSFADAARRPWASQTINSRPNAQRANPV